LDKLIIVFILLLCLCATASAEQVKLLWEQRFDKGAIPEWKLVGETKWLSNALHTESDPKGVNSAASLVTDITYPRAADGCVLRAEWSLNPVRIGGWGQDFRLDGGPMVVEFTGKNPTLNARHASIDSVTEGKPVTISCDFNRYMVFSWKIDGKEQLKTPVPAWYAGGEKLSISMNDFNDTKSSTDWNWIRISRVTPDDATQILFSGWDEEGITPGIRSSMLVGIASPMDKVFREAAEYKGRFGGVVKIAAAGRERESFQIVTLPVGQDLTKVSLQPMDLIHDDYKTKFPASRISWHPVGYVQTKQSGSAITKAGWWWPDILMPAQPFDVQTGYLQPAWVTVDVPAGTKPGRYRGWINIMVENSIAYKQKIELTVRPYDLPLRGKLKTAFCLSPGMWEIWYKPDEVKKLLGLTDIDNDGPLYTTNETKDVLPHEKWLEMYDFLLTHRISPTVIYSGLKNGKSRTVPGREDMQYCYDRGMNATCLTNVDVLPEDPAAADKRMQELEAYLKDWEGFIKEKDWKDFTWYVHGFDESEMRPDPAKNVDPSIRRVNGMIKTKFPWVKRETANPIVKKNIGYFDIWDPITAQMDTKEKMADYKRSRARGEESWAYVCCGPGKPYANFFIDFPGVDPRILGWQYYQHNLSGFLYYLINHYTPEENWSTNGPKWPEKPWNPLSFGTNSDGILIYPGPDATPLASTRFENVRDGIEDYEALGVLSDLTDKVAEKGGNKTFVKKAKALLSVPAEVSKSWTEYTLDPGVIENARAKVDAAIEEAMALLGAPAKH